MWQYLTKIYKTQSCVSLCLHGYQKFLSIKNIKKMCKILSYVRLRSRQYYKVNSKLILEWINERKWIPEERRTFQLQSMHKILFVITIFQNYKDFFRQIIQFKIRFIVTVKNAICYLYLKIHFRGINYIAEYISYFI